MGKVKAHAQEAEDERFNRELARERVEERQAYKQCQIQNARDTFIARGLAFTEHNLGYHLKVADYDYWPTTGKFKHKHWKHLKGVGIKALLKAIGTDKTNAVVYSHCGTCKAKFPHRESDEMANCNACVNKRNAAEQRQRRRREEEERRARLEDENTVVEFVADWKNPCVTCSQVPSIKGFDMCAACTFGEAQAQQDLISGEL